jgi:PEP-CTERM motif
MNTFASILKGRRAFTAAIAGITVAVAPMAAQAQSISGTISFTGGANLDEPIATATQYISYFGVSTPNPVVLGGSQTGTFAAVPAMTQVTFLPFTFLPFTAPQTLWSFTSGGDTYSFTATSLTDINQVGYLNIQGSGTLSVTGFANTPATWSYTDTGSGTAVSFGASITATPEPSTIALMAVFGLIGCAIQIAARRKTSRQGGIS